MKQNSVNYKSLRLNMFNILHVYLQDGTTQNGTTSWIYSFDLVVFLPIIPSVLPRLVSFQALYCIFCVFSYIPVSSRVFLCFLWHCTVFLLFLYYCVFLYTFVFLCFLVKCNIVFDILQQLAWATLNSKAKHSTPL